jgi:hypothetical protein
MPRYMAADSSRVFRGTPSTTVASFSQRSAIALASSPMAAFQASFTSANETYSMGMPTSDGAGPESVPRTARILESSFIRRTHSAMGSVLTGSGLHARSPLFGVDLVRALAVAATKSATEPPFFTMSKHFAASIRSSMREEDTKPTFGVFWRRNPAV